MKHARPATSPHQTPSLAVMKSAPDLHEQIRRRAYQLYEERGRTEGHELGDWLQAESEMAQRKAKAVTA
jgi:hypothetical protein